MTEGPSPVVRRPSSIVTCVVLLTLSLFTVAIAQEWQAVKSQHFLVYYLDDKNFADNVSRNAERYYDKIASDLGYSRYDNFWQWDNRVKIYIYPDRAQFVAGTGVPREWAEGLAKYKEKEIISYKWSEGFLETLLPHELTHLIFRDFVGFPASGGGIPLWLDEGVAQWEEESMKGEAKKITKELIRSHSYIPIRQLTEMDVRKEENTLVARNFYFQATTLVGFLVEKYGGRKFTLFCRGLRDGKSMDEALSSAYTNVISDTADLERKWVEYYGG